MNSVEEILKYYGGAVQHSSLKARLKIVMQKQANQPSTPKKYYFVTALVNPVQKFWEDSRPDVKRPPALQRKLSQGKRLHDFSAPWFKRLEGFCEQESLIDGAYVGVPRVRGKIDFFVGKSIIEFKTKDIGLPSNESEFVNGFPHDLEQLVFYSALHPENPPDNFLVFMNTQGFQDIRAFKVTTLNFNIVKEVIRERIRTLDEALGAKDCSKLSQCRYLGTSCHYDSESVCTCKALPKYDMKRLLGAIKISPDREFTDKLILARSQCRKDAFTSYSTYNILAPRKYLMFKQRDESPSFERSDSYWLHESCLWNSISNLEFKVDEVQRSSILNSLIDERLRIAFRWFRLPSSSHDKGEEILPYIQKISESTLITNKINPYYLAELGVICAAYGKTRGILIVMYPQLKKELQVFEITYKDIKQLQEKIVQRIDNIEAAAQSNDISSLPPCPTFMNDKGKCSWMKECNQSGKAGCA